jgi:phage terminase large subunit-like protein
VPDDRAADRTAQLLAALEAEWERRKSENRLAAYRPYAKQAEFHAAGATHRERLFLAGNQLGKTVAGSFETAIHLTGRYPEDWKGRVFKHAPVGWAAGVTGETTRDTVQRLLLGRPGQIGTGAIPRSCILDTSRALGVADLMDTVRIAHTSGREAILAFKFYEKGREKWQAETLDFVWDDEEPPLDIYTEGLTRTNATGGLNWLTATPLKGMTDVIKSFVISPTPARKTITMTIDDAEHYTPEQRKEIADSYPAHEREARTKGIPTLGSGRVFPVSEEMITEQAIHVPDIWARIAGHDFGWDHPQATVWLAHDRDNDVVHVTDCHRVREATPVMAAPTIKSRGAWIPVAWPHDGLQHDKGSGEELANQYRQQGVNMLPERATFEDGGNGVEAGVMEMLDRMQTGRLKVAAHLVEWFEEFRMYHRKNGLIVKEGDDLMSATRYGIMMLRYAKTKPKPASSVKQVRAPSGDGSWMA